MDSDDQDQHPDLRGIGAPTGFGLRARWQARRARARSVKQWRDADVRRRQRRRTTLLIAVVTLMPIVVVAAATYWPDSTGKQESQEFIRRTPPSTIVTKYQPDAPVSLYQPFVGTPAASWKDGMRGLRSPKTRTVGDFSRAEVAKVLKAVRRSISASYLDRRVIEQHNVGAFLRTLAPDSRQELKGELKASYVVLVHQDYPLLPATPKINGSLSVRAGQPGELIVRAKFAVAYAFDIDSPDRVQDGLDIVAVIKSDQQYRVYSGSRWQDTTHGVHLAEGKSETFAMSCEHARNGYLAPFYADRATSEGLPEQEPEAYFDPEKPLSLTSGCQE